MLDALAFGREASATVEAIHGAVQRVMSPAEVGRHQVWVVEVGQRCLRVGGAGVEHGLRERLQFRPVCAPGGVGKVL